MSSNARLHYHHSLDTPLPVRAVEGVVRLKGWCFVAGGDARPQLQLRLGQVTLSAAAGADRPDVAAAFPQVPHARHSGFEISGHVPAGLSVAELWAGREGFGWQLLASFSVYGEAARLHAAIDLPEEKEITSNRSIDGWCFHPQRELAEVWLHYGTRSVRCRHFGHERSDVARQAPHLNQARFSGFSSEDVLKPGEGRVRIRAVDRDGGVYFCETDRSIRIQSAADGGHRGDPRLDGRALSRAYSVRQATLPLLRVIVPADHAGAESEVKRIAEALNALPGERWRLFALITGKQPAPALAALAAATPRLVVTNQLPADARAWDLRLAPDETPDIHGLMAAMIAVTENSSAEAIYGDFATGADYAIQRQPGWSRELALAGGVHPLAPVIVSSAVKVDVSSGSLAALAAAGARVFHVPAALTHRPAAIAADLGQLLPAAAAARKTAQARIVSHPDRIRFEPGEKAKLPSVTAIVVGAELTPAERKAFGNGVGEWLVAGDIDPVALGQAAAQAKGDLLWFITAGLRPATMDVLARLAMILAENPGAAALPLKLRPEFAPWTEVDALAEDVRKMLARFDPAFAPATDRSLALLSRQYPYLSLPGLLIGRARLAELGGLATGLESVAGALLDFSFRLRAAGTAPVLVTEARVFAPPAPGSLSSFEQALLLDRWDRDEANPLRIRPLVALEVLT